MRTFARPPEAPGRSFSEAPRTFARPVETPGRQRSATDADAEHDLATGIGVSDHGGQRGNSKVGVTLQTRQICRAFPTLELPRCPPWSGNPVPVASLGSASAGRPQQPAEPAWLSARPARFDWHGRPCRLGQPGRPSLAGLAWPAGLARPASLARPAKPAWPARPPVSKWSGTLEGSAHSADPPCQGWMYPTYPSPFEPHNSPRLPAFRFSQLSNVRELL